MKKVAKYIIILLSIVLCFSFSYQPITNANSLCDKDDIPTEVKQAAGCEDASSDNKNGIENAAAKILNGVIAVLSLVAVGFIIYGGISYITSAGDSAKTKKAKDTILYASIGLVVVALATAIANFTVVNLLGANTSNQSQSSPQTTPSSPGQEPETSTYSPKIGGDEINFINDQGACMIKGNVSTTKTDGNGDPEKIYHLPGQSSYKTTVIDSKNKEEFYFCTEKEAIDNGFRPANTEFTIKAYEENGKKYYILPGQSNYENIEGDNVNYYSSISEVEGAGYEFNTDLPFNEIVEDTYGLYKDYRDAGGECAIKARTTNNGNNYMYIPGRSDETSHNDYEYFCTIAQAADSGYMIESAAIPLSETSNPNMVEDIYGLYVNRYNNTENECDIWYKHDTTGTIKFKFYYLENQEGLDRVSESGNNCTTAYQIVNYGHASGKK